jgi:ParB-like chromosome segregation protein Spo0J
VQTGVGLPPISVYRFEGRHYVRDGHHRVSVARALGAADIDADVTELSTGAHR